MRDPIVARLIADLIGGFQKQLIGLEKDGLLLGEFLHNGRRLRWQFSSPNPDNLDEGGGFFVEMRVLTGEEIADEMEADGDALLRQARLDSHDWEAEPFVWLEEGREK